MKANELKVGAILSYVQLILGNIISIIYTPIMLRLLGQNEYGLYNLSSSAISYLGLLSFGFGSAYIRYYSKYKAQKDDTSISRLNGTFLIVYSIIAVVALLAGMVLIKNVDMIFKNGLSSDEIYKSRILMSFMVFNLAISFPMSVFISNITANEKFFFQKIIGSINTVINPFIMLPVLLMGYKSVGMVVVTTVLGLVNSGLNIWYCFKKIGMKFTFGRFDFELMKEISIFSSYIFLNMIVDQINWNVDRFLLGMYKGTGAVAIYGIGSQFNTYYMSFSTSVSNVFIPKINRMVNESNDSRILTEIFTKVGRIQFIILSFILSGFVFFGKYFIEEIFAGAGYELSYPVALLLMFTVTVPLIQNLGIEIQKAKNMHKFRSILYFLIAIGNLLMSIPLCKYYGVVGCAIGTSVTMILGNGILMNWYYHTKIGLDVIYFWKNIVTFIPGLIIPATIGVIMTFIGINSIGRFLVMGIIYIIVFLISIYKLSMNEYEKQLFIGSLFKNKVKITSVD
ncbi:lipopolysaccharide biosynthesis protein [Terrisporobacter mayombei]|uniref:Lipid II flippase MurJ n=1 Tax=Terrisporobacter mayombei TaxID=1541 RepID=A0ABY9Q865_9FIRM|nr:oligosaccharide flippase family protein [Terrisporobacter mayombei]MCC3869653.1 oligosaccharide flippase family protein [Terrisporobacter mayombei]WMT83409.1 lipid II flippase MurJ [Terrisporobacter mayombei]